mgnify:CR=1 FL=1
MYPFLPIVSWSVFLGKDAPVQRTLFEVFREHNDKCAQLSGTDMAPATVQRYETSLKHTQDFVWETYHKKDILLGDVSRQFIEDYEFWLKTEKKCCHNTATKYLKNFKKIIRIALAKGWMKNDPFSEIKFSLDKVEPDFLEDSEIQKLISKRLIFHGWVRCVMFLCSVASQVWLSRIFMI